MSNPGKKIYLNPKEVAELLMVSVPSVRNWSEKGMLKAMVTPGGHRRFFQEDVILFAQQKGITLNMESPERTRVLVVDDDVALSKYLKEVLSTNVFNFDVECVNDSFKAGQMVQSFKPAIILLDIMMPGMNGLEVCQVIKNDSANKDTRIIAISGLVSKSNQKVMLEAGAESCLQKPITKDDLMAVLL